MRHHWKYSIALLALLLVAAAAPAAQHRAAILVEPSTMTVLWEENADALQPTASMIKMLTLLVITDAIEAGEISWQTPVEVTREMARTEGSQVYLEEGEVFPVRELFRATQIKSANDAAAALAITVAGSQDAFVERMRAKALALGIPAEEVDIHTPHGLPTVDTDKPEDRMTARALARIGAECLRHPEIMELAGTKLSSFRNGEFQLYNSNHLLRRYDHATGIKTGYHRQADFNLTASANKDGMDLVAVVMGAKKWDSFDGAKELLEWGFENFRLETPLKQGQMLSNPVMVRGERPVPVRVMAAYSAHRVVPRNQPAGDLQMVLVGRRVPAPVRQGEWVGDVVIRDGGEVVGRVPAVAASEVTPPGRWERLKDRFWSMIAAMVG